MLNNMKKFVTKAVSSITAMIMTVAITAVPVSSAGATKQYTNDELKDMALEVAFLVNELRAEKGLHPVYVYPYLCDMAQVRSREIMFTWEHERPDGSSFSTIFDRNLVPFTHVYENIAKGYDTPQDAMDAWYNSDKHREAMLDPDITHMGVGVGYEPNDPNGHNYYWQQTFIVTEAHFREEYIPQRHYITPQCDGDVTGDGVIDIFDYLALAEHLYNSKENIPTYLNPEQSITADCFIDGLITEADAQILVSFILGKRNKTHYRPVELLF